MLVITTVEGKEYSLQAPDEVTRDEWRTALEENIRRLDPSKVAKCFLSTVTIVYVIVVISSKRIPYVDMKHLYGHCIYM